MQDTKPKAYSKGYNHIQNTHKPQLYYQHLQQQQQQHHQQPQAQQQIIYQPQYVPVPVMAKTAYVPQPPQHQIPAMIIIAAQPTPTAYPAAIQQLLNYFHNNPQARQQLLYGTSPQQATTPTYVVAAAPAQYYPTAPTQYYYTTQPPQQQQQQVIQQQPLQLQQIADIAQSTAQKYYGGQITTATPIVTGLENFTPEQQAQIKARLNDVISQDQQQQQHNGGAVMNDFVPSPEIKGEEGGVAYITESDVRGQAYTAKG